MLLKAVQQESMQTLTMMQWLDRYYTIVGSHIGWWIQNAWQYAYAYWIGHQVQLQSTQVLFQWYAKGATKIAKRAQALDQSVALWGSESAIRG